MAVNGCSVVSAIHLKNVYFPWIIIPKIDCKTVRIFAYSSKREQSNERSGTRLKTESETGERLSPHTLRVCKTLTPRFTDFLSDFEKKSDCFAVYS